MRDTFSTYHPIINFTYFFGMILFSMIFLHPVLLALSLSGAFLYSLSLHGQKGLRMTLLYLLPMMVLAALINPLFNHEGMTILWYLRGNPITAESIAYGIAVGFLFGAVILWFSCYNKIMTSDKFMYLFGKVIPSLSLIFSMVLRFVPRFQQQIRVIAEGRRCIGRSLHDGSMMTRIENGSKILSVLVSWALESTMETADSMRSRGYSLPGRTSFSIYRFDKRDQIAFVVLVILLMVVLLGTAFGQVRMLYFPILTIEALNPFGKATIVAYGLLSYAPLLLNLLEELRWRHLESKI